MKNWRSPRSRIFALGLTAALAGCAADRAGQDFRARLPQLVGQPVRIVLDELGSGHPIEREGNRHFGWSRMTFGGPAFRECEIDIVAGPDNRIASATMRGSDYDCGLMLVSIRKR